MEKTIKWKKKKYLQACDILDYINESGNFCNIRTVDNKLTCNGCFKTRESLCCEGCDHLTEDGCNTDSIMCKLSYCYVDYSPSFAGLDKTEHQKMMNTRYYKVKHIITNFFKKYDIPLYYLRASMKHQFALQELGKLLKHKHINEYSLYDKRRSKFDKTALKKALQDMNIDHEYFLNL